MYRIVIVEDDPNEANDLAQLLESYASSKKVVFEIEKYKNPLLFLQNYDASADIIFLDIEMPEFNGMDLAKKIRSIDVSVILIFVTHLANYAIEGYTVEALDFIVKPAKQIQVDSVLDKAIPRVALSQHQSITIKNISGMTRIPIAEITYVEVQRHRLFYHLVNGNVIDAWGNLSEAEKELPSERFARCNNCYLVNLKFVRKIDGEFTDVAGNLLKISRPKKKEFMERLVAYIGTRE